MSRCRWTRSLCLLMLPALVLCGTAPSWGTISFSNNTLTYSSTSDLSTTIDPSGQKDVTNSYGITKASFQALNPQIVAFNGAPTASQTLRYLVANYDASHTVTFTFPSAMYNYGSMTTSGRGSFSGSATQDAISTVPVQNGSLYDWFDASISCTGSQGVQSLGFCVAFRSNQAVAAGEVLYTLSDASTETVTLPALGGSGNPEYVFIGYTAPSGKTITRVQAARTSAAGGGYVSIDDLSFVMSPDTTAPTVVSDLATSNPTASSITLSWTAPGDDGSTGTAASYDIRYSSSAINEGNWDAATPVADEPTPAAAGTGQDMTVSGLSADTTYYFAMKTSDEVPNTSGLSNCPSGTTSDVTAPAAITDLATSSPTTSSITLTWTAPGDSGSTGTATSYDVRCSTSAINEGNWASATQVTGEPTPAAAGTGQNLVVSGLSSGMTYYFAIKASDEVPNTSGISNCPSGTTAAGGSSTIVALKRDSGLTAGGAIDERFADASVRTVSVADAAIYIYGESRWMNGGASGGAGDYSFYKFDLSSIPANSTINLAQLRLYHTVGNGGAGDGGISMVLTHDWAEGAGSYSYPGATAGVSYAHPSGTNTGPSQNATGGGTAPLQTWGTGNDSFFDIGVDASSSIAPSSAPIGQGYHVLNVTSHVQQWVNATYPNYGWAQLKGYWDFHLSEAGTAAQPVLFVDYTPSDTTAPAAVADLAVSGPTTTSLTLSWTAPGDDGSTGTATAYDIRYATSTINDGNWASATQVTGEPTPAAAGTGQNLVVSDLTADTTYYFAMKTSDEVPNTSALSNSPSGTTTSGSGITPAGTVDTTTQGTWQGVYGADGHILFSFNGTPGWPGTDVASLPGYISDYSTNLYRYVWAVDTGNAYDLQQPGGSTRKIGCVYTDVAGTITLVPSQNKDFTLRLYLRDQDALGRSETLSFTGAGLTGTDLIECTAGKWVSYPVHATVGTNIVIYLERVTAVNAVISAILFDSTPGSDTTAPAAVSNLATSSPTASSLTLSWTAPGDDGSTGTAASYDIRYRTGGAIDASNWASATQVTGEPTPALAGTSQNMVISGLSAGTTYYFAIKTSDEVPNTSALSNSPSGTTAPPGSSTIIALKGHAGLLSGGDIDARFTSASAVTTTVRDSGAWGDQRSRWQNGGASLTVSGGYAFYKFDLGAVPELACATINLAQLRIYHTTGNGSAGMGGVGMVLTYDWLEGTVNQDYPGAAGGVSFAHPVGYNTAWEQNASGGTEPPLQSWGPSRDSFLSMSVDASPVIDPFSAPSGVAYNTFDVTSHVQDWARGSHPNYGWVQQVGSWDFHFSEAGSDYEPVLFIDYSRTGDVTAPAAVTNLAAGSATSSSLTVTWTAPGDDGPTGTATSYDLRYSIWPINAGNWGAATQITSEPTPASPGTNQSMVVTGLKANTTYYFALKTADEMTNTSALSNLPSAPTLPDVTAPAAVNNLGTSNATSDSMTLSWTAPGDDGTVGTATTYDIRYSTSTINEGNWASATQVTGEPVPAAAGTNQSMVVTGLAHNTTYYFAMKTSDEIPNASALSNVETGTTPPDVAAPAAVTNLAITKPKSSTVTLTWAAPGDDGSTGTASSYDIRYSTSAIHAGNWGSATPATGEPVPAVAGTSQKIVIRNLTPQTTYYFAMKATDEAGNVSGLSNVPGGQTTDTSLINRPVICREDFQYLGAFLLPYTACDTSTAFNSTGLAIRRVDGQLRLITGGTRTASDPIYEVAFPGWGTQWGAWPQATPTNQWGTTVYGTPSMKEIAYPDPGDDSFIWTHGLLYDEAANRLYYSFAPVYNVAQGNEPSLGYAVLEPSGPVAHGPWNAPVELANTQKIRGGSLLIPQWFANAYLGGRTLGLDAVSEPIRRPFSVC